MWPFGKKQAAPEVKRKEPGVRMYGGAAYNRTTADWVAQSTSSDSEIFPSLRILRNRARQVVRDNDYAKSVVREFVTNVVGPTGIQLQSQVKNKPGKKLDEKTNEAIETAWREWCKKGNCHTAGQLSFHGIQKLCMGDTIVSGEILIRKIRQKFGKSKIPFALELIESDQLIESLSGHTESGNVIRMGVEKDKWNRPVAYWLYPNHPGDMLFNTFQPSQYIRVPAEEIIHLFIPDRAGQSRGVTAFHSTIKRINNMGGYEEAEIISARASAALMGFIETPDMTTGEEDDIQDGERVTDFEPGQIRKLFPGEKFSSFAPVRPGGTFDPFMRFMLRGMSAGVGVSYEAISKDYSQGSYSSVRQAMISDRDHWRMLQAWLIENVCQSIFEDWLMQAVLSRQIVLPHYLATPAMYEAPKWKTRGWSWIDPLKEVQANKIAVRSGFNTLAEIVEERGGDLEDLLKQRKQENEQFKELGLVFDTDASQVDEKGMVQKAIPTDTTDTDPSLTPATPADPATPAPGVTTLTDPADNSDGGAGDGGGDSGGANGD